MAVIGRTTAGERRTRILGALADGEWRVRTIAAWADISEQAARADLRWLERESFAHHRETDDGRRWEATAQGAEYINALPDEDKSW